MDEQQHPDGRPRHEDGAPEWESRPTGQQQPGYQQPGYQQPDHQQQPGYPHQQPSPQSGYQQQTGYQQPGYPQQPPAQQPGHQQQPSPQQGYASPPPAAWNPAAQGVPVNRAPQHGSSPSAPPAAWQGDQSTYLQTVPTAVYQAPSQGGYAAYQQASSPSSAGKTATTRSTWSLVTGVVGLVVSVFVGWGFPLSIVAIVLGLGARRREPQGRGRALTGLVTGFVGLACSVGWLVYSVVVIIGYVSA